MTDFSAHREAFHTALIALSEFIREEDRLSQGLAKGRLAFYGTEDTKLLSDAEGQSLDSSKAARFQEWFCLERPYGEGAAAPIHVFVSSGCPGLEQFQQSYARSLGDSRAGVFLVKDMDDSSMDLEDAVSGMRLSVLLSDGERSVESGDTLLGRLLPAPGTNQWLASDAMERITGSATFDAFVEDVERNKLQRGQEELDPVTQLDLEMLLRLTRGADGADAGQPDAEALEADLATLLEGVSQEIPQVAEICRALRSSQSPGAVMAEVLEDLAFHTQVDIDSVRRLILELWNAYQGSLGVPEAQGSDDVVEEATTTEPRMAPSGEEIPVSQLGLRLLAELEAGEAKGEETEHLFDRLERIIDGKTSGSQTEGPPDEVNWKTSDEGNLEALLAEYLWERENTGKELEIEAAGKLTDWVRTLAAMKIFEVEMVDEVGLAKTLVRTWAEGEIQVVQDLMGDLVAWEAWLTEVQELEFGISMVRFREALLEDSKRLASIHIGLQAEMQMEPGKADDLPSLSWHVLKDPQGGWILESSQGRRALEMDCEFVVGDLILGALGEKGFRPGYRMLPRLLAQALTERGAAD